MGSLTEKLLQLPDSTEDQCKQDEDFVDPWTVTCSSQSGPDYDKLIGLFLLATFYYFIVLIEK